MKICFIADTSQIHSQRWISYFANKGYEVSVISIRRKGILIPGCQIYDISHLPLLFQILAVYHLLRNIKPNILHAHTVTRAGWLAALSNFHPFILTPWGSDTFLDAHKNRIYKTLAKFTFNRADLITSNSEMLANAIVRFGAPRSKIRTAHWGIELDVFKPELDTTNLRKKLGLEDKMTVFSVRNFFSKYNITTIVKAIPLVLKRNSRVKFILKSWYKDLKYEDEIHRLIIKLGIRDHIIFLGEVKREDLPLYYNLSEISISVPYTDSLSQSFLDAMACGSALIVSDLESTKEWIKHEVNGLVVPVGRHKELAEAILRLLSDNKLRKRMVDNNYKFAKEKGDQNFWMGQVEKYYHELLK